MGRQLHVTYKLLISKGLNRNKCGGFAANVSGPINQARVLKWDQRFELSAHITASGSSRNVNRHANGSNYQLQGINGTKRLTCILKRKVNKQTNTFRLLCGMLCNHLNNCYLHGSFVLCVVLVCGPENKAYF